MLASKRYDIDLVMASPYYTKAEDGSFHLVTFNETTLGELIAQTLVGKIQDMIANEIQSSIEHAVQRIDIAREIEQVDIQDIAEEAVRDEVTARVENMDISVDVSI